MNVHVQETPAKTASRNIQVPILIIGCGFGGIATAIALTKAGMGEFTVLERAADVGGVWRDNSYPGAACDVVSRFYSFSFEQGYQWSGPFAPRDEIWDYTLGIVEKYGIRRHVTFNTEVASAAFDEAAGRWIVETTKGDRYITPILISAVGLFNRANLPNIPGRDSFKGESFHSSCWNHDYQLEGKTVAVIGNGASCVQFLPKIAPKVGKLHLFQRSPQYVMPKAIFPGNAPIDLWLGQKRGLRWLARLRVFLQFEHFIFRRLWNPGARLLGEAAFRKLLADKVKDPELREKLTPKYPMGCKRQLVSNEWYDAVTRPNVELVDTPIVRILPDGIETHDGQVRKVDAIIYGTGFTPTDFLQPMRMKGLGGKDLNDAWRHGAEAYLGITVTGFPNFFMLYGPNTNAPSSIIFMLECQARYIVDAIRTLGLRKARYMNARPDVQSAFNTKSQQRLSKTIAARADCNTYFKTAEGRITTNWAGFATEYRWLTQRVRPRDYDFVE